MHSQSVKIEQTEGEYAFIENTDTVLVYQASAKSLNGKYERANYVHPLYGMNGEVLTEDFPQDHKHHRGIFWAWHQIFIGNKRIGDGWEIKNIEWDVADVQQITKDKGAKAIKAEVLWLSPNWTDDALISVPFIREITTITVFPAKEDYRIIDFKIKLWGLEPDIALGGSEDEKGYGGFSARIKLPEDIAFIGAKGVVTPKNTPVASKGWLDFMGTFGESQNKTGVAIIAHPENPGYPNPWILRKKASMQNAVFPYPGRYPVFLKQDEPLVLKYRVVIHNAGVDLNLLSRKFQ